MIIPKLKYPNIGYEKVIEKALKYFEEYFGVYAIALIGSLARGKAVEGSCIDLFIFLETKQFKALASTIKARAKKYSRMGGQICFYEGDVEGGIQFGNVRVDIGFTDGKFKHSSENSFDITRDEFEKTIGNLFSYSIVLFEKGTKYQKLKEKYLPFYDEKLRKARLNGTAEEFEYKIWKTRWLAKRGEYFAAFDSLLEAQRIFLQHLFIKRRKYPIDYVKWLKEQCAQILGMPELYDELASVVNHVKLTEKGVVEKSKLLEKLFLKY
jgi:predicted nucleotidyltransferase